MFRIGHGIDFHKLEDGKDFWIGGIKIPHTKGAVGHSDADVLLHAICDALYGALALGDIGTHFPDTDPNLKGIDSKILLRSCIKLIREKGYEIENLDSTLCLQAPKINLFILALRQSIADVLEVELEKISVKATTTERLGFVGREEGVEAHAVVFLKKNNI